MADTFTDAVESGAQGAPIFSQEGLDLVRTFEGFRPDAYYDLDNKKKLGKLTVGYGFTDNDIPGLKPGFKIDKAEAEKMLPDLINRKYAPAVLEKVKTPLNNQQFSALTSLVYNIGPTKFGSSTLLKKLNSGDYSGAAGEFKKWNKAGGKTLDGLVKRRRAEEALFKGETDALGSILESQKFGVPEDFVPPLGEEFGVSEAITPEPDLPSLPAESELTPEQRGAKVAEDIASEIGLTPESELIPEQRGAKVAEDIASKIDLTPEERGAAVAKRIAEGIEAGAEDKVETKNKGSFDFGKLATGLGDMLPKKESGKAKEKAKEQEDTIPFARSVNFSGDIPKVPSGLPANRGLGRRVG